MDSINLRHRQCPLLPSRSSQEFCNVSNFSSQLLTVNRKIIEIIEHHKLYISQKALLIQKIIIHYSLQINVQLILSNFLLNIITRYIFYNWSSCAVYMKQLLITWKTYTVKIIPLYNKIRTTNLLRYLIPIFRRGGAGQHF